MCLNSAVHIKFSFSVLASTCIPLCTYGQFHQHVLVPYGNLSKAAFTQNKETTKISAQKLKAQKPLLYKNIAIYPFCSRKKRFLKRHCFRRFILRERSLFLASKFAYETHPTPEPVQPPAWSFTYLSALFYSEITQFKSIINIC